MMKKIGYKTAVWLYLGLLGICFLALPIAFYAYDPLQVFHAPWAREWSVGKNMRLQAAGVINNYEFDSVILGTSMLENTSANAASGLLGGKFVNISMPGSYHPERSLVLDYALKQRHLKSVVYSLDLSYLSSVQENPNYPQAAYAYLYDYSAINDFSVYYNWHFAHCLLAWSVQADCVGRPVSLDRPNAWYTNLAQARRFGGVENWLSPSNGPQVDRALASLAKTAKKAGRALSYSAEEYAKRRIEVLELIDSSILVHAKSNPEVIFYYVFPPHSRVKFSQLHQTDPLDAALHEAVIRHFVLSTATLPNVRVFGYEDQAFLDDLANYKDPGHYKEEINQAMLVDMAKGQHRLTPDNLDHYLDVARQKALEFDLVGLGAKIDAYLQSASK